MATDGGESGDRYSYQPYFDLLYRFCQIRYFFEKTIHGVKIKMFHGLWFHHGSRTVLQETAHSKALYLLDACDDIHVTAIVKKCNFRQLKPGEGETLDDGSHDSNDFHCGYVLLADNFFLIEINTIFRLFYDEEHVAFLDIPDNALEVNKMGYTCFSCEAKEDLVHLTTTKRPDSATCVINGISYHVHDFVYVHPSNSSKLLDICQITKIYDDSDQVGITLLGRYDEYVEYQKCQNNDLGLISDEVSKLSFSCFT